MKIVGPDSFTPTEKNARRLDPRVSTTWPCVVAEFGGGYSVEWSPAADLSETDREYLIRAELPAVHRQELKITAERGTLTIEGRRRLQKAHDNEKFHRVENFYGTFSRSFCLPENADTEAMRYESQDGMLTVRIPKARQRPRLVAVR